MAEVSIYEGTVVIERESGKVYLATNNVVTDLNHYLSKSTGEKVKIAIEKEV